MKKSLQKFGHQSRKRFPNAYRTLQRYNLARSQLAGRRSTLSSINASARSYRALILSQHPENAISAGERKDIEYHAHSVWGSSIHTESLLFYRAYYGSFCEGWVPATYFRDVLMPSFKQSALFGAKTLSKRFLPDGLIPDLAYYVRNTWTDGNNTPIAAEDVADMVFADHDEVYVKNELEGRGVGVTRETRDRFDVHEIMRRGNLSIQAPVRQHSFFDALTTKSVSTLRVVTVKPSGEAARAPASMLSTGIGDNPVVGNKRLIRVGVSEDDGALGAYGCCCLHTKDLAKLAHHPDSGVAFNGLQVPGAKAAHDLCRKLHDRLPHLTIIGWDVVIEPDEGMKIIEINTQSPSLETHQLLAGAQFRGFGWEDVWKR